MANLKVKPHAAKKQLSGFRNKLICCSGKVRRSGLADKRRKCVNMNAKLEISQKTKNRLLISQRDELTGSLIYAAMARREKNHENKKILERMAKEETEHARVWQSYTGAQVKPNKWKLLWYNLVSIIMGFTFVLRLNQKDEIHTIESYKEIAQEVPEAAKLAEEEHTHENALIDMLDEERLQYVGSMVLGLNDALVELTGTIAGMSFALMNTRLVALSGIITGVSATLSMAASNYLAQRSEGNPNAMKSSIYTGVAYLLTVAVLVLPFLLFPAHMYVQALGAMLVTVILIIMFFNYYISVAKSQPFLRRFGEMAIISLSVAAISFLIGIAVKYFLGIDLG